MTQHPETSSLSADLGTEGLESKYRGTRYGLLAGTIKGKANNLNVWLFTHKISRQYRHLIVHEML